MKRFGIAAVTITALVASACGGGGSEEVAAGGPTIEDLQNTPLSEFMGWNRQEEDFDAEFSENLRRVQEMVVTCMAEQGFEYVPVEEPELVSFGSADELDVEWGTREFAETYGYGDLTMFEQREVVDRGAEEFTDPNQAYLETLSASETEAYYAALHGSGPAFDESMTEEEMEAAFEAYEPTGCEEIAQNEVWGEDPFATDSEAGQEFEQLIGDLWERQQADPRVVDAQASWSACMVEAGYDVSTQDDVWDLLAQSSEAFYESQSYPGEDLTQQEWESMTEAELEALYSQPPTYDEAVLAEAQQAEIAMAVADFDCGVELRRVSYDVQVELEAQFLEDNSDLLEQVRSELP